MNTEIEITFESYPISFIQQLEQEIEDCKPNRLSIEDVEEISDNYQENLEYSWWLEEQKELIAHYKSLLSSEQMEWYNQFKD